MRLSTYVCHDAAAMTALTDVGKIFVRCEAGIRYNPAESITAEDADARALLHLQRPTPIARTSVSPWTTNAGPR